MLHPNCGTVCPWFWQSFRKLLRKSWNLPVLRELDLLKLCTRDFFFRFFLRAPWACCCSTDISMFYRSSSSSLDTAGKSGVENANERLLCLQSLLWQSRWLQNEIMLFSHCCPWWNKKLWNVWICWIKLVGRPGRLQPVLKVTVFSSHTFKELKLYFLAIFHSKLI